MLRWQNGRLDSKGDKLGVQPQFQAQKASRPTDTYSSLLQSPTCKMIAGISYTDFEFGETLLWNATDMLNLWHGEQELQNTSHSTNNKNM